MDSSRRQKILENKGRLAEMISFKKLRPQLDKRNIFSSDMLIDIDNAGTTDRDKNNKIFSLLPKRGPKAYENFVHCLIDSNQFAAAKVLHEIIPDAGRWQGTVVPSQNFPNDDRQIYPMKSNPRGVALIISNTSFENNNRPERRGGEIDEENLKRLFQYLGFTVELPQNKNEMEIRKILDDFQNDARHKSADACIIVILSHGCAKGFDTYDASSISNEEVLEMFNNVHCPLLHNKPKLFFFQHCRGDEYDHAIRPLAQSIGFDSIEVTDSQSLPTWTDMKICYSTSPKTVSMRSDESGTLFIAVIVDVFSQHAHEMHLDDLLQEVTNRMVDLEVYGWKQSPEFTSRGWRRKLYFNPGLAQHVQ